MNLRALLAYKGTRCITSSTIPIFCRYHVLPKIVSIKKGSSTSMNAGFSGATLPPTSSVKQSMVVPSRATSHTKSDVVFSKTTAASVSFSVDKSPDKSDALSVSMDESMSTCDSLKSPEVEYMDNNEIAAVDSIERKASNMLCISEHMEISGNICKRDVLAAIESDDKIVDVDDNLDDPQLCATIACDIYKHLRASEAKKRPATNFMERVQKDINASMRAILIDWLVEVAEEYRLVPDTLYLTVNYIDRYLSGNVMDRQRLQLLGVACMMIASKYEEICAPQVEEFCYITDNTYFKDEVLQMESAVLNYLKFEMTAPTPKCFLRRFVRAAQGVNEAPLLQLECMANYVAELSLLEYSMLCFAPSLIAASSIFLAKFILVPSKRPWTNLHTTKFDSFDAEFYPFNITPYTSPMIYVIVFWHCMDFAATVRILVCLQLGRSTVSISTNLLRRNTARHLYLQNTSTTKAAKVLTFICSCSNALLEGFYALDLQLR
ncbi:UNVERIFIED_CONTAM: Cyclin-A1-1 [Sesamum calycinum]|uniref:Cyclin-A1-1 n=1 Tax=Sesamum calycinum TaxID=2727403 RepID=A0AAW2LEX2_9LAMI